ncbi:MAG: TIGR02530 family flagellar biosynthesis protein [Fimbriimonadaceae bacterium]
MSNPIQNSKVQDLVQSRIQPTPVKSQPTAKPDAPSKAPDFEAVLADRLKISGHAKTRLASRNIELSPQDWERVMDGVDRAASKGARESLVMIDDSALVVSVKNRTVITAVDQSQLKQNVFTNIDSAVIV